ncbi:HupE/UreJ family protein [Xanthobacter sp. V4C-4]|uniref:HupE/UreJ family protein n=1 Tax=Xanthobacter cornucopiae TaxID=3119924 RepID=UPI0037263725
MTNRLRPASRLATAAIAVVASPPLAHAHLVTTRLGDFYGGALHPLTDLQQLLPWIALAALAAFQGARYARWVILVFPLALAVGGAASLLIPPPLPFASVLGLALVAGTGLGVAAAARLPLPALLSLATVTGLLHGYENGAAMAASTDPMLFLTGILATGYVAVTLMTGAALAFLSGVGGWRPIALRAGGSWVAAVGIMVLGLHLVAPGAS